MTKIDSFFVRLQDKVIYFTETDKDTLVLAAIHFGKMQDSGEIQQPGCFQVSDAIDNWTLCAEDQTTADEWICGVRKALGQECTTTAATDVTNSSVDKILQPLIIVPLPSPNCDSDWNYN